MAGSVWFLLGTLSLLFMSVSASLTWGHEDDIDTQELYRWLAGTASQTEVNNADDQKPFQTVNGFSWKNCGGPDDVMQPKTLSVGPDPIKLPGNVTVSLSGSLKESLVSPIELGLSIKKKELFWIPIPCVDDVGSCDYSDICSVIQPVQCPPVLHRYGIPCHCPFKAGSYNLPASTIPVTTFGIPSWLESGEYQVTATLKQNGTRLGCIHLAFSLN